MESLWVRMSRASAWNVYHHLLAVIREHVETPPLLAVIHDTVSDSDPETQLELLPNLKDLPFHETANAYYMGGVGGGLGLRTYFTLFNDNH
jgi:hypothetical protein